VSRNSTSDLPMDSLTIHGVPVGTSRGSTVDPVRCPRWADADTSGSTGTMTRAAVIAPSVRPQRCCVRRQVRAAGVGADRRPEQDSARRETRALGTAATTRGAAVHGGTGRIGHSSSSASRLEMPQFVHPPAQRVMARKCEGTDAPGSRPNRNRLR